MDLNSWQMGLAMNAALPAIMQSGLSKLVIWVVRENNLPA
jgi:hypothetical protein